MKSRSKVKSTVSKKVTHMRIPLGAALLEQKRYADAGVCFEEVRKVLSAAQWPSALRAALKFKRAGQDLGCLLDRAGDASGSTG